MGPAGHTPADRRALSVRQIALRWSCKKSRVYRAINDEGLEAFKMGPQSTRVWVDVLERWERCNFAMGGTSGNLVEDGLPQGTSAGGVSAAAKQVLKTGRLLSASSRS